MDEIIPFFNGMGIIKNYLEIKISRKTNPMEEISLFNKDKKIPVIYLKK